MAAIDLTGRRFGRLVVLGRDGAIRGGHAAWRCRCDCGQVRVIVGRYLRDGAVHSCGCYRRERIARVNFRHGMRNTPEYHAWHSMKDRCTNPRHRAWRNYGGRGITVCLEWLASFEAFIAHVGSRPSPDHSLDRIDNNGGYGPGNVRWATLSQQMRNRRPRPRDGKGRWA
jgi:hypothetical protein